MSYDTLTIGKAPRMLYTHTEVMHPYQDLNPQSTLSNMKLSRPAQAYASSKPKLAKYITDFPLPTV